MIMTQFKGTSGYEGKVGTVGGPGKGLTQGRPPLYPMHACNSYNSYNYNLHPVSQPKVTVMGPRMRA